MILKKNLPLQQGLLTYFYDDISIGLLIQNSKNTVCSILDPDTLTPLGVFLIREKVTSSMTHLDNDTLYLTTDDGIIGYDTFSGQKVVKCVSNNLIPLDFCCKYDTIYAICGIPLVNSKHVNTNNLCLSSHNLLTGKHLFQSQNITGLFTSPICYTNIWCPIGQNLYEFNTQCELVDNIQLSFIPSYSPILGHNFICVASEDGHMEIFSENRHKYLKIFIEKNNSAPICIDPETIAWAGLENLHIINVGRRSTEKIPLNTQITSGLTYSNGIIYAGDRLGNLVSINISTKKVEILPLSKSPVWKPIILGNYIFAMSQTGIYQCLI
jgi:hypothetical protein